MKRNKVRLKLDETKLEENKLVANSYQGIRVCELHLRRLLIEAIYQNYSDLSSEVTVGEKETENGMKEREKDRTEERLWTDGNRKRNGEESGMARNRYKVIVTTPPINKETAKALKIMNQTMGFEVIANSQDSDGFELRPVLQDAAKQIPQENEKMAEGELERWESVICLCWTMEEIWELRAE